MSDTKTDQEPTMEEILASIRRIISEDGGEEEASATPDEGTADVLELTEDMISDDEASTDADSAPPPMEETAPVIEPEVVEAPAPQAAAYSEAPASVEPPEPGEPLVSPVAGVQAGSAFAALASAVTSNRDVPLYGGSGRSLEQLVKELLRPMLKEWLDRNLPHLVERLVQAEISRLSSRSDDH